MLLFFYGLFFLFTFEYFICVYLCLFFYRSFTTTTVTDPINWVSSNKPYLSTTPLLLKNRNFRRNWAQRLQKKVVFFPKFKQPPVKYTQTCGAFRFFGNSFFFISRPLLLKSLFLIRFDLLLKRIVRKKDKTLRRYWITTRVLFNLTRQSKGARMGKGKGKNIQTFQLISPTTVFISFSGVRFGRLLFFLKFFNARFPCAVFLKYHWSFLINRGNPPTFRSA